jgi:hypothetical protein
MNLIIYGGAEFYCPRCDSLYCTSKKDIYDVERRPRANDFMPGEGQHIEASRPIKCKCGFNCFLYFRKKCNWRKNNADNTDS